MTHWCWSCMVHESGRAVSHIHQINWLLFLTISSWICDHYQSKQACFCKIIRMLVPPSPPPSRATQYCAEFKLIARHQLIVVVGVAMEYISSGSLNVARADISLLRNEVEAISCRPWDTASDGDKYRYNAVFCRGRTVYLCWGMCDELQNRCWWIISAMPEKGADLFDWLQTVYVLLKSSFWYHPFEVINQSILGPSKNIPDLMPNFESRISGLYHGLLGYQNPNPKNVIHPQIYTAYLPSFQSSHSGEIYCKHATAAIVSSNNRKCHILTPGDRAATQ